MQPNSLRHDIVERRWWVYILSFLFPSKPPISLVRDELVIKILPSANCSSQCRRMNPFISDPFPESSMKGFLWLPRVLSVLEVAQELPDGVASKQVLGRMSTAVAVCVDVLVVV